MRIETVTSRLRTDSTCRLPNRVSYSGSFDLLRCPLSHAMSSGFCPDSCHFFRTSQTCTCNGNTSCSCRRGYARPAVGSRPRSRENMVAVNADALVRLTRAVLPARSSTPAAVPTAALESDHRDSNCGSPCEGKFVLIVTFSPVEGPVHSIWLGRNGFTPSFMDDLYCPR